MSAALQVVPESSDRYTSQQLTVLKATIAKGLSDMEFALLVQVSQRTGLDLFARQLYGVKRGDTMTLQTGIDGYRLLAARTGALAGIDDAVYDDDDAEHPARASVTVWRLVQGQRVPFTATARWKEYEQKAGGMWAKMPYLMLGKCAEALALRKAFPAELSGVYTGEEMDQAGNPEPGKIVEERPQPAQRSPLRPAPKPAPTLPTWGTISKRAKDAGMWETAEQWEALLVRICGVTFTRATASDADKPAVLKAIEDKEQENHDLSELHIPVATP
jgi:phage recombination protein Bet